MQVLIRQKDVEGAPNRRGALRVGRTHASTRFDLPETGGQSVPWARERRGCRRQPAPELDPSFSGCGRAGD
jgi:hypothetical protein